MLSVHPYILKQTDRFVRNADIYKQGVIILNLHLQQYKSLYV
jgi:hypothetical protein